jgi:class 3 adenylate cyclase
MAEGIAAWLGGLGLERYAEAFTEADVDLEILPELTESDLEKLGVTLGHRKRILRAIAVGSDAEPPAAATAPTEPPAGEGERRQITMFCCDLVGSTALAARLDPEDLRTVISSYHARCAEVVAAHGGEVAQFLGDGVMVEFGYPRAHEDDAERAIRCARDVIVAVRELKLPHGVGLQTRVGVETGTEVVGDLHGASRDRSSVVGTTPSLASRYQNVAAPETVVVGPTIRRLLRDSFALTSLGFHEVKGVDGPVELWRIDGDANAQSRFAARHAATTPFVGRDTEIGLLGDRWRLACEGEGQIALLVAEPGIGKSRIVEEFAERVRADGATVLRVQCAPNHTTSALQPVIGYLERAAAIEPADSASRRFAKLSDLTAAWPTARRDAVSAFALLLGLPGADDLPATRGLSADQRKALIFTTLLDQLRAFAVTAPVLWVVEDLHWVDPTTLEFLTRAAEAVRSERILIVATARPEFSSPWGYDGHLTMLTLNRLGRRAVETMVRQMSGGDSLPTELVARIVERTDGVPLFVEELTRTILDSGAGVQQVIPETLREVLAARLDALSPVRDVAQACAVLGREFSGNLLAAVSERSADSLNDAMRQLCESGLMLSRTTASGVEYFFKHALVRDAAYESLLRVRRQQLHLQTARAIVAAFTDIAENQPEVVAQHFEEGGAADVAVEYWRRAADRMITRSAYQEAAAMLRRALALLPQLPPDDGFVELELLNRLGVTSFVLQGGSSAEGHDAFELATALAANLPESETTFIASWGLCFSDYGSGRVEKALNEANALIELAERLDDRGLMLEAVHARWGVATFVEDVRDVIAMTERGMAIYAPELHHHHITKFGAGHDSGICGLAHGSLARLLAGQVDAGRDWLRRLAAMIDRLEHPYSRCHGTCLGALCHEMIGEFEAASELAAAYHAQAEGRGYKMLDAASNLIVGAAQFGRGERDAGISMLTSVLDDSSNPSWVSFNPYFHTRLAFARLDAGDVDGATVQLARAERLVHPSGCFAESEIDRAGAAILRAQGASSGAVIERLERAAACAREHGVVLFELRARTDLVEIAGSRDADRCGELLALAERVTGGTDLLDVRRALAACSAS